MTKIEFIKTCVLCGYASKRMLGRLGKMAKDIEYMHNFQNEREDIVEYIYKTHEIVKLLKEGLK